MISLFITFLPYTFMFYFLYRSLDEPVFFMGIPLLMFLRASIFFEKVELFILPFRSIDSIATNADIFLLVWLTIFWIIFKIRSNNYSRKTLNNSYTGKYINIIDYLILFLMIITIIGFVIVLKEFYLVDHVFDQFFVLISLFLGFFFMKDIAYHTEVKVLNDFLFSIVIINTIASLLFIIHQGLHFKIYQGEEYSTEIFQGVVITRTFWFIPALWSFSIAYLLTFKKSKSIILIIMLIINLLAIFISYNRSTLINNSFIILLYFIFIGYKKKDYSSIAKNLIIVAVAGMGLFFAVSQFLPASTNYFQDRFKELDEKSTDAEPNNLIYRFQRTGDLINIIEPDKTLIGYGPVTETQTPLVEIMHEITADMAWAGVAFNWGFLGLALFILLFIGSMIKAFNLFMKAEGLVSQLALLLLLTIVSQAIESITGFAFMSPNRFALGLWYFGILSGLLIANKKQDVSINEEQ